MNKELLWCSVWALMEFSGQQQVFVGLHDRTMAFQGESCCMLQWSDLFLTVAPLDQMTQVEVRT